MANINDRDVYNRDNNPNRTPETLNQPGDYHVVKPDPVNYQQGYVEGKALEQQRYEANQQIRDNDNAGRGLLVGILATGLLAIVGASFYFLTQRDRTPVPVNRTIVVPSAAPSASPSPQVRERIIERDRVVPVPQESAPTRVITIPQPSAPAQPAPAQPAPAQPSAPAQSTPQETTPDRSTQPEANDSAQPSSDSAKPSQDSTTSSPQPSSGQ